MYILSKFWLSCVGIMIFLASEDFPLFQYGEFEPRTWRGVLDTTLCDKVYQLLAQGRWFSPGTPASSTTKSGRHDIAEILLKVALKHQNQFINQSMPCPCIALFIMSDIVI